MDTPTRRRVHVTTLGCRLNQYDSEMLLTQLRSEGYVDTPSAREADLVVVNTCAVTETAERKGRAAIRAALRQNPQTEVVATGCHAERAPEALLKSGASRILGNREKERFLEFLNLDESIQIGGIHNATGWTDGTRIAGLGGRVRAFLKVQDGCSQHCTYCIVPQLRGAGRSLPIFDALERARVLIDCGVQEIVVTGVALGTYGFDWNERDALPQLLEALAELPGLRRLRLSSVEPWAVSERFLKTMAAHENICPHLHLPFQSGSDAVLRRMNRRYTVRQLRQIVETARGLRDDWGIGADVITGFPGETPENFAQTRNLLTELEISYLHVFPFSARPGTAATRLPDGVTQTESARRADKLRELSRALRGRFHDRQVGREGEVIAERRGAGKYLYGHARNYADVAIPRDRVEAGQVIHFRVERADADFLYAQPIV